MMGNNFLGEAGIQIQNNRLSKNLDDLFKKPMINLQKA